MEGDFMPNKGDSFMTIIVKPGPLLYEGKKHSTHREKAEALQEHAKRYEGLRELLSILAGYHFRVMAFPEHGISGEGDTDVTIWVGKCGSCPDNPNGYAWTVNGVAQKCGNC